MDGSYAHFFAAQAGYRAGNAHTHIPPLVPPPASIYGGHPLALPANQPPVLGAATHVSHESPDDASDDDQDGVAGRLGMPKKAGKAIKRRSTKACDNCRKSKCKCTRAALSDGSVPTTASCQNCTSTGAECTFNGASRKRGPPKGYIDAIESRLHRMEALLGGLLQNDDPRAQALLTELIGDSEARDILKQDLKAATDASAGGKSRKSWKLPPLPPLEPRFGSTNNNGSQASPSSSNAGLPDMGPPRTGSHEDESESEGEATVSLRNADDHGRVQRRKLNSSGGASTLSPDQDRGKGKVALSASTIPHTGTATYSLSGPSQDGLSSTDHPSASPDNDGDSVDATDTQHFTVTGGNDGEPISELADVVGQLSLDENGEVRYHGRSAGLYLISKSHRYKNFFWRFPRAGVWPHSSTRNVITEAEALDRQKAREALPPREEMDYLLELYWAHVHPSIPVLYKFEFMRQYRSMLLAPNLQSMFPDDVPKPSAQEPTGPESPSHAAAAPNSDGGPQRITVLLLLVMFALAARFSDKESKPVPGEYWDAGDKYLEKAKRILNQDYARSKLSTCQAMLLLAYREIGVGAMAESWLYTGMSIRMAQDMGMFRDVEKWFMPVNKFSYDEKQTRKRVWWTCVVMDKYVATYIGRPMMIFERDYDTAFPSADEPDEHEQWRPIRPDGSDLSKPPSSESVAAAAAQGPDYEFEYPRPAYPTHICYAISCFNRAASLSVLISRIVANIYAIRVRVIGQTSETLLSLLDQNLANWYLDLPEHLRYNPSTAKSSSVPPPHVLTLHAQFYTALILLHRPFITGQQAPKEPSTFPSHSICTTAANSIATIATSFSNTFGLRQAPAFMVYYIFTAAILHVYNSTFDPGMAVTAKRHLLRCMNSLKEMSSTWGGAVRAWELLVGLVDLRDVDLSQADPLAPKEDRGIKRPATGVLGVPSEESLDVPVGSSAFQCLPTFHTRNPSTSRRGVDEKPNANSTGTRKTKALSTRRKSNNFVTTSAPPVTSSVSALASTAPDLSSPVQPNLGNKLTAVNFNFSQSTAQQAMNPTSVSTSYNIFGLAPQSNNMNRFMPPTANQTFPESSTRNLPFTGHQLSTLPQNQRNHLSVGASNAKLSTGFNDMFVDYVPGSGHCTHPSQMGGQPSQTSMDHGAMNNSNSNNNLNRVTDSNELAGMMGIQGYGMGNQAVGLVGSNQSYGSHSEGLGPNVVGFDSSAFFGMPLSADGNAEDWQRYLPAAFLSTSNHQGDYSGHGAMGGVGGGHQVGGGFTSSPSEHSNH